MLYYVKTGIVDSFICASGPKQAAIKILLMNEIEDLGMCTIVSKEEINEHNTDSHIFFLTENILSECNMKLVN
jgi:hypothetical protein